MRRMRKMETGSYTIPLQMVVAALNTNIIKEKNMIYGYARVSTKGQARDGNSLEVQEAALRAEGATEIYVDSFTGTKVERPELDKLLSKLQSGDTLMVTKLDRFARTAAAGSQLIEGLISKGIKVNVLNMGKMDDSSTGRLIRHIMLAFAEFERDMIIQRVSEGKAAARQNPDFREGRPRKYTEKQLRHAMTLLSSHSYSQVAEMTGISKSTLVRYRKVS